MFTLRSAEPFKPAKRKLVQDTVAEEKSPIPDQRVFVAQRARPKQPLDIKFNLTFNKNPKEPTVSNKSDFPDLGSNIKKSPTHQPMATKDPSPH